MRFITEQNRKRSPTSWDLYDCRERQKFIINTINELDSILVSYSSVNKKILKAREEGLDIRSNEMPGRKRKGLWIYCV